MVRHAFETLLAGISPNENPRSPETGDTACWLLLAFLLLLLYFVLYHSRLAEPGIRNVVWSISRNNHLALHPPLALLEQPRFRSPKSHAGPFRRVSTPLQQLKREDDDERLKSPRNGQSTDASSGMWHVCPFLFSIPMPLVKAWPACPFVWILLCGLANACEKPGIRSHLFQTSVCRRGNMPLGNSQVYRLGKCVMQDRQHEYIHMLE